MGFPNLDFRPLIAIIAILGYGIVRIVEWVLSNINISMGQ